jgi:RNA polymerase sigma-70 factor (sigma-E family)
VIIRSLTVVGGAWVFRRLGATTLDERTAPSFAAVYHAQRLAMVRLAAFLVGDLQTAEDVAQDAFAGLHKHWHRLRDPEAAVGYLRRAVVNGSRSLLRRRRTARAYVWPVAGEEPGADSTVLAADEQQRLRHAVARLPRRQREVLVLRYWSDLTEAQIADTLGISAGTVKSTASRALQALETALSRQERIEGTLP